MTDAARYAVYFAPDPAHALWQAGCDWLGRDAADERDLRAAPPSRAEPWLYGFHATLMPPMRLRAGLADADLDAAVRALAAGIGSFQMPRLHVDLLADFVALRPEVPLARAHPLWRLADACVTALDRFRAPLSAEDMARRLRRPLAPNAMQRLQAWGYPYVLDGWRFHMTLSDSLPAAQHDAALADARRHFSPALTHELRCSDLCLFRQSARNRPFMLQRRYRLAD